MEGRLCYRGSVAFWELIPARAPLQFAQVGRRPPTADCGSSTAHAVHSPPPTSRWPAGRTLRSWHRRVPRTAALILPPPAGAPAGAAARVSCHDRPWSPAAAGAWHAETSHKSRHRNGLVGMHAGATRPLGVGLAPPGRGDGWVATVSPLRIGRHERPRSVEWPHSAPPFLLLCPVCPPAPDSSSAKLPGRGAPRRCILAT